MLILITIFGIGLIIGSFVNAVVWRLHQQSKAEVIKSKAKGRKTGHDQIPKVDYSIARGRSMCPECKHQLAVIDLIPVMSWLMLRGKCRYCHKPISVQYPIVELLTGGLFLLSYIVLAPVDVVAGIELVLWLYFVTVLMILAVYDLHWYILPDSVLLPAIVVGILRVVFEMFAHHSVWIAGSWLLPALAAGGSFYALAAVSKGRWMGGGDIKLVFFMGLVLGWSKLAVALLIAFNVGALVGVLLIALKLKHRRDHIPFGPFLVGGTIIAMLYGQTIVNWYLQMIGYA